MIARPRHLLALLATLCTSLFAAAQSVLVVDRNHGPFTELTQALAVAVPGDRIEVGASGAQPYFAGTVSIGVEIVATAPVVEFGGMWITNLPANQSVRVEGLSFVSGNYISFTQPIHIDSCAGRVHLHRIDNGIGLRLTDSRRITVSHSTVRGLMTPTVFGNARTEGIRLVRSSILLQDCTVAGGNGMQNAGIQGESGEPAVAIGDHSDVTLIDCNVRGGHGQGVGQPSFPCSGSSLVHGSGAPALHGTATSTRAVVVGASVLEGGLASCGAVTPGVAHAVPVAGLGSFRRGPNVQFVSSAAGGQTGVAIAEPPLVIAPLTIAPGTSASLTVDGVAGTTALLAIDLAHDLIPLFGTELPIMVSTSGLLHGVQPAGAQSSVQFPFTVPNIAALNDLFVYFQGGALHPSGAVETGSAGFVRIE